MTDTSPTIPTEGSPAISYEWPMAGVSSEHDTDIQPTPWPPEEYETYKPVTLIIVPLEPAATSPFMDF